MVIGNGLIARAFSYWDRTGDNVLIFASGVSNSKENRPAEFLREQRLLEDASVRGDLLVYFSTCSIDDETLTETPYVQHKIQMEQIVRTVDRYAIFRLPQVVGCTANQHTLTNFIQRAVASGLPFEVWANATRRLIDVDDVVKIVSCVVRRQTGENITENLVPPSELRIFDLVAIFEKVLGRKAVYEVIDSGGSYSPDSTFAEQAALEAGVIFDEFYNERLIRKYYGPR